jgi:hypothetical protein
VIERDRRGLAVQQLLDLDDWSPSMWFARCQPRSFTRRDSGSVHRSGARLMSNPKTRLSKHTQLMHAGAETGAAWAAT